MQVRKKSLESNVIHNTDVCYWELSQNTSYWSIAFIHELGYDLDDVLIKLDFFLNRIIHPNYKEAFKDNFYNLIRYNIPFRQNIEVLNKSGKFLEYVCLTDESLDATYGKTDSNTIYFFKSKINTHEKVRGSNFYYLETADMTSTGSWYVDFEKKKSYWDNITRKILEYPEDYIPSLKMGYKLYAKEHQEKATMLFFECATMGKPFDVEIKMMTSNNRKFWVRAKGKPVFGKNEEIIGIRGVFQDIDDLKQKELELQRTSDIIASQNNRLYNFAHIVSHNLRSHTSNLSLITHLIQESSSQNEKLELIEHISDISDSLNKTIEHLNDVVTIQTTTLKNKVSVSFEETLTLVKKGISQSILETNAVITADFSEENTIDYIPAYLESILLNLITNSIKYKHPDRKPEIFIKTFYNKDKKLNLSIQDNGLGINLKKFANKIFGMYETFHYNEDAVGIGLFITKNQIEALNGKINVESKVDEGTTFTIQF